MSAGPKLFLLKSSRFDSRCFQSELSKICNVSSYTFEKLSDLDCFQNLVKPSEAFIFIIPFTEIEMISRIRKDFQSCKFIVVDDNPNLDNALLSSQKGADKYLSECSESVANYIQKFIKNSISNSNDLGPDDFFCTMIGRSSQMKEVFARIQQVANSSSTVLITGASGCGKELVANAIHELSHRSQARQISINCGAIPSDLLESELFGHVKGAFTGAISDKKGKFELADKGSIFLDEIGDMDHKLQVKLLRALQSRQIEAVGGDNSRDVDVRIIAATHQDLRGLVSQKLFREDLYYRLNVIPIHLPELKKRQEDIPLLISHFIEKITKRDRVQPIELSKQSLGLLLKYEWPGNIRELENLIERLMVLRSGHFIEAIDLPDYIFSQQIEDEPAAVVLPEQGIDLKEHLAKIELSFIEQALERTGGNKKQASQLLSIKRTTLVEKIKKISKPSHDYS